MEGGRTAQSALQLPLNIAKNNSRYVKPQEVLKQAKIIFWDECTIAHTKSLEAMNRILQTLEGNSEVF